MQGVRRQGHLRARAGGALPMQGVRRQGRLQARAGSSRLQGVRRQEHGRLRRNCKECGRKGICEKVAMGADMEEVWPADLRVPSRPSVPCFPAIPQDQAITGTSTQSAILMLPAIPFFAFSPITAIQQDTSTQLHTSKPLWHRTSSRACKKCAACKADDGGSCIYCLDKPKNGGKNTLRRPCCKRQPCLNPGARSSGGVWISSPPRAIKASLPKRRVRSYEYALKCGRGCVQLRSASVENIQHRHDCKECGGI